MSIAKTTRPHLLTREAAAARIEALEAQIAADTIRLTEDAGVMEEATMRVKAQRARIKALEAALRKIEAHPDAESRTDGRSYSYPGALMRVRQIARAALASEQDK
ncbi:MAG: hypothetical protein ABWY82_05055 [Tardiphaga sp.]